MSLNTFNALTTQRQKILCGLLQALFLSAVVTVQAQLAEPMLPVQPSEPDGFFPTLNDESVLRSQDYARSSMREGNMNVDGPDNRLQTASGPYHYLSHEPNFYQLYPEVFSPVDDVLGVFTPQDAWTLENERLSNASLTVDGRLGLLTRRYDSEQAHVKLGLLSLDVLWLGGGVVYSDFQGDRTYSGDNGDGWTGYIDLAVRGAFRLTDSIYLSAVANLMYLPFEQRFALRFGNHNVPALLTRFNWADSRGPWDLMLSSEFRGVMGIDAYVDADSPELDRSGRYFFGFRERRRTNEFQTDEQAYFSNRVAFNATRAVLDEQWRWGFAADHTDFWRTWDFVEHRTRDHVGTWLGYEGSVIPFAPKLSYDIFSNDGYEGLWHRAAASLTGRLTENLNWRGMAGYRYTSGTERETNGFIWEVALDHNLTRSTRHSLEFGENFYNNEFLPETLTSRYARYTIQQRLHQSFYARAFGQFANRETVHDEWAQRDRWSVGMSLVYNPMDFTSILGTALYESADQIGDDFGDADRWIYRLELQQQLGYRLTGRLFYQYEDRQSRSNGFNEHMAGMSMRRFF